MPLCVVIASNAIQLEAARRLRDGLKPESSGLEILLWEPQRISLTPADRRRWRLRLPARPLSYLMVLPLAAIGMVRELRLSHLSRAGRGLQILAHKAGTLSLLDDGLDQYRQHPKAIDPKAFAKGTPCWLFSDAPSFRADWCQRFSCQELGPLYRPTDAASNEPVAGLPDPAPIEGTLIIDSPGVERLQAKASTFAHPWVLVPHPVVAKRSWRLPLATGDRVLAAPPETLLARWRGTVLVGESLMLLAALRLCHTTTTVHLSLPDDVDPQLLNLCMAAAMERPKHMVME